MKKQNKNKVSLVKCMSIFDGLKMPWGQLLLGLIFTVFSSWAALTTVTFSGNAVDASGDVPTEELVAYVSATLISLAFLVISGICTNFAYVKIRYLLRNRLWQKIMVTKQSVYDVDGGETLISRVTTDSEFASKFFEVAFGLLSTLISVVMYVLQMWLINKTMLMWAAVVVPICIILGMGYAFVRFLVYIKVQGKMAEATAYLTERTKDMNLIKTCNATETEIAKGKHYFHEQYKVQLKLQFSGMLATVIGTMLDVCGKVIPFLVGAVLVANGEISVGVLVTIQGLFVNILNVGATVTTNAAGIKEAHGALIRIVTLLEAEEEDRMAGETLAAGSEEDLIFEQVNFSYNDEKQVLKNISCRIPKNQVTAVVGSNGSGKTTMMKLLTRLYEPDSGMVRFGDTDASVYSLDSWRQQICLIAQGSPMMAGTIRENICYGRADDVSEEELMRVAKLSHVWDFVQELPEGFDSEVAGGGSNFSGGQRQCIAIARAMMSKAEYLLLDESTSNLDVKREKDVMEAMSELMKDRTTIIIAHSLATIRNADHVIVLNNGQIETEGTPADILRQTGNYLDKMMKRKGNAVPAGNS